MPSGQAPIPSGVSAEARHTYSLRTWPILWQKCSVWDGLWKRCQDLPIHGKGTWRTSCIKTGTLGIFPDFMELLISQIVLPLFFNPTVWHAKFLSIRPTGRVLVTYEHDSHRIYITMLYHWQKGTTSYSIFQCLYWHQGVYSLHERRDF